MLPLKEEFLLNQRGEHSGKKGFWTADVSVQHTWNCCFMNERKIGWKSQSFAVVSPLLVVRNSLQNRREGNWEILGQQCFNKCIEAKSKVQWALLKLRTKFLFRNLVLLIIKKKTRYPRLRWNGH